MLTLWLENRLHEGAALPKQLYQKFYVKLITADEVDGMHTDQKIIKFINLEIMNKMKSVNGMFTLVIILNFD
jgi:hypothetical protein